VYDQIDNLIKTSRPRRSKSTSKSVVEKMATSSQHSETSLNSGSVHSRNRTSIGDGRAVLSSPIDQRAGSRTSVDIPPSIHKRADSAASGCSGSLGNSSTELEVCFLGFATQNVRALTYTIQERMLSDEFDELMRSGATMKVSLTPDRLKTLEVRFSSPDAITLLIRL
jgi:hypothetical protein